MNRLISLEAENIMSVKTFYLEIKDRKITKISGRNGQGKTTILRLEEFLRNTKSIPNKIIREGEEEASIIGRYETPKGVITVEKVFTSKNEGRLKVSTEEMGSFKSPQQVLDALLGEITPDLLRFSNLGRTVEERREQIRIFISALNIVVDEAKLSEIVPYAFKRGTIEETFDNAKVALEEVRKEINKKIDYAENTLERFPDTEEVEGVTVLALISERDRVQQINIENRRKREALSAKKSVLADYKKAYTDKEEEIKELEEKLTSLRKMSFKIKEQASSINDEIKKMTKEVDVLVDYDLDTYNDQISKAEETNKKALAYAERKKALKTLEEAKSASKAETNRIKALEEYKKQLISGANIPVAGLSFDECVTYNGIPLNQLGKRDQISIGFAVQMLFNPKTPLIRIDNGNEIDSEGWKIIEELSEKYDVPVLAVMVDESKTQGIVIEDGEVIKDNYRGV